MIDAAEQEYAIARGGLLSPHATDAVLDGIAGEIERAPTAHGAMIVRRLHDLVDACAPARPTGGAQLGALPEILGTVVTLQYPLEQLERFLSGNPSDIADRDRAAIFLSFVRFHVWKLQHSIRGLNTSSP
jgi:hypothetical protein